MFASCAVALLMAPIAGGEKQVLLDPTRFGTAGGRPSIDNGSYRAGLYDAVGRVVYFRIEQRL